MKNIISRGLKYIIYLLVFLLPLFFLPFSFEAFEFNKQYILFFLVSLGVLFWVAKMVLADKEVRIKVSFLDIFVLIFLFVSLLSAVFSVSRESSWFGFYGRFSDGLIPLFSLAALYFLIVNNVAGQTQKEQKVNQKEKLSVLRILQTFLASVSFIILFSYLSIFGVWEKLPLPLVMRQRTFNPVGGSMEGLAVFLAVIVVLLTGLILMNNTGQEKIEEKSQKIRKAGAYILLAFSLGLLIIISFNPAWLIIMLSLFLFLVVSLVKRIFKQEVNKLLLPILLVILSFVFLFIPFSKIQQTVPGQYLLREQVLSQEISWMVGVRSATDSVKNAFLGSGIGTFHYDFAKFKPAPLIENTLLQIRFDRPGNHLAEVLGTMGFLGIISYLALIGAFLLTGYFFLRQNNNVKIALFITFLALIASQFLFYQNMTLAFTFWLFLGLSAASWQKPVKEKVISFNNFPEFSLIFSVALSIFILFFAVIYFFTFRFYMADVNYRRYFETADSQKLERAVEFNPYQSQYRIVLARDYLNKIIAESQKPADQINEEYLSTNVYLAIDHAKRATELSPGRVSAWENLGVVYREIRGAAEGAEEWGIKSFQKAIELEPTSPALHTELGKLYLALGRMQEAREKFTKAKELMPNYADASVQMSLVYEAEGNKEEAIRQVENIAALEPNNIGVIFQLGRLYFNDNRIDEAILKFEDAIRLFPNHSNSIYSLGMAYEIKGEIDKAITSFERVLELNPGNEDVIRKIEELKGEEAGGEIILEEEQENVEEESIN